MLKKIECIIQPFKLEEVKEALKKIAVEGMTVTEVKGCGRQRGYTGEYGPDAPIRLLSKIKLEIVTEEEKVAALGQCRLLVMLSPYESLSIITLEAWKLGAPVLANGRCRVLMGQCLRSNGGLFYHGYAEFAEGLSLLLERPQLAAELGRQGREWVDTECAWETVEGRVEELLERTG